MPRAVIVGKGGIYYYADGTIGYPSRSAATVVNSFNQQ